MYGPFGSTSVDTTDLKPCDVEGLPELSEGEGLRCSRSSPALLAGCTSQNAVPPSMPVPFRLGPAGEQFTAPIPWTPTKKTYHDAAGTQSQYGVRVKTTTTFTRRGRFRGMDHLSGSVRLRCSRKGVPMSTTSGSSLRHLRIATLITILLSNLALIGIVAPSPASAAKLNTIYGYSCCTGFGTINYHPGESIKLSWKSTALRSSDAAPKTLTLSASASGPFPTVAAASKAFSGNHSNSGRMNFSASTTHVSDEKAASPVSLLHVPANAGKGFYLLTTIVVKGPNTSRGGLIFHVVP